MLLSQPKDLSMHLFRLTKIQKHYFSNNSSQTGLENESTLRLCSKNALYSAGLVNHGAPMLLQYDVMELHEETCVTGHLCQYVTIQIIIDYFVVLRGITFLHFFSFREIVVCYSMFY